MQTRFRFWVNDGEVEVYRRPTDEPIYDLTISCPKKGEAMYISLTHEELRHFRNIIDAIQGRSL